MNNFYKFLTPEELISIHPEVEGTLEELTDIANQPETICPVCKTDVVWRYGQSGLCFTCTTGEADASEDYELIPAKHLSNE